MSPFLGRFVSQGHLVDSGLLTGILNLIIEEGADYRIIDFQLGKANQDISQLDLELRRDNGEALREVSAMFDVIRGNVPFALAGSIRDDGPLPDTVTDVGLFLSSLAGKLIGSTENGTSTAD